MYMMPDGVTMACTETSWGAVGSVVQTEGKANAEPPGLGLGQQPIIVSTPFQDVPLWIKGPSRHPDRLDVNRINLGGVMGGSSRP